MFFLRFSRFFVASCIWPYRVLDKRELRDRMIGSNTLLILR